MDHRLRLARHEDIEILDHDRRRGDVPNSLRWRVQHFFDNWIGSILDNIPVVIEGPEGSWPDESAPLALDSTPAPHSSIEREWGG